VVCVHHDLESAPDYFDWLVLLNVRVIADGPFAATFTAENLSRTYGGRTHVLSRLKQETVLRAAEDAEIRV
jgi:manganese/zinc/iron transport system ATP- binding protein